LPSAGVGNVSMEPQLADISHLSAGSPCIGAGFPIYATGTDIDGEAWGNPPAIGCDQYRAWTATGPLSVRLVAARTNVAAGYAVDFHALIEGRASASAWDFGDGLVVSNRPYASHAWTTGETFTVVLRAWNESNPGGVSATVAVQVVAKVHYVAAESMSPAWPYASWATAATNIQDAVDAATVPGALVLVSNGVYAAGGRAVIVSVTNRLVIDKPVVVRSVNGPEFTVIQGWQVPGTIHGLGAIRCVYLTSGAELSGFTLTNGATSRGPETDFRQDRGGGVWCESAHAVVSNCVLVGNSAGYSGGGAYRGTLSRSTLIGNSALYGHGGGACEATLNNCTLIGNSALNGNGGGVSESTLNSCTIVSNSATSSLWQGKGGGVSLSTAINCIIYDNTAGSGSGPNHSESTLNHCCTTPLPTNGAGNIINAPLFVDQATGNLRLQTNSPCVDAGHNAYASGATDLDGNPRIVRLRVDMGAYEYQGAGLSPFIAWLLHYGMPTDGSADFTDSDDDRLNNWQEWLADTNPTNAQSVLRIQSAAPGPPVTVQFTSSSNRLYTLLACTNLAAPIWAPVPDQTDVPGVGGLDALRHTNAVPPRFYKLGVRLP
jgi:PKD repeat protein